MGTYAFYEFKGALPLPPGRELLPLPVRTEQEAAVFGGPEVRVDLLPDELAAFLAEYPDVRTRYAGTVATVAWLAGVSAGLAGDDREAERHFDSGLKAQPGDLLLRANYAVILHIQERKEEARVQYEMVLAGPEPLKNPVVSLLAARLHAEAGRYRQAYELLEPLGGEFFTDDSYWELLSDVKERMQSIERATPKDATCAFCGSPVGGDQRFCYRCGKPVQAQPSTARRPAFCGYCGSLLVEGRPECPRCGRMSS